MVGRGGRIPALSPEPGALEAVEDEVQAELVFVAVVVARLEDVIDRQLGEAWVVLCGELQQESLRELLSLFWGAEGQTLLLQCEAVDVAVEG